MTQITTLKWTSQSNDRTKYHGTGVKRAYWKPFKTHLHSIYEKDTFDGVYITAVDGMPEVDTMLEIGSDLGRSTAWWCLKASNIDVYEYGEEYISFCRSQANNLMKHGPIRNIEWHETNGEPAIKVLESISKQYDCIKFIDTHFTQYTIDLLCSKLKHGGIMLLHDLSRGQCNGSIQSIVANNDYLTLQNGYKNSISVIKYK